MVSSFFGTFLVLTAIAGLVYYLKGSTSDYGTWFLSHILSGGVLFGGTYMLTDPVTMPITRPSRVIYGMDTVVYILVIASLVQIVGLFIKKYSPALYKSLGIYLPLITTNCAVLGVVQENTDTQLTFALSMANALGTSLGYLLMIFVFACIRTRLDTYNTPRAFKGIPIALITAAIMAMAMMGLTGIGA